MLQPTPLTYCLWLALVASLYVLATFMAVNAQRLSWPQRILHIPNFVMLLVGFHAATMVHALFPPFPGYNNPLLLVGIPLLACLIPFILPQWLQLPTAEGVILHHTDSQKKIPIHNRYVWAATFWRLALPYGSLFVCGNSCRYLLVMRLSSGESAVSQ